MGLSNRRHQAFISELFLCGMKQVEAYQRVYPKSSYDSARANAARLIAIDSISEEITRRMKEKQLSADEVLARLGDMARGDVADFVGIERPSDLLNEEYRGKTHVIKKFKRHVTTTRTQSKSGGESETINEYTELEMYSALDALEKVGRNFALFTDNVQHSSSADDPLHVWLHGLVEAGKEEESGEE